MTIPQSKDERELMDKTIWSYMMKKSANNITIMNESGYFSPVVAGQTKLPYEASMSQEQISILESRYQTYTLNGVMKLVHPFTKTVLQPYRQGDLVLPQT